MMGYTVKTLAKFAGVTIRTIQYYNAIGLLKPAYCSENGYRYYEEEQLLILKKILFFRDLGMKLKDIKRALSSDQCEQSALLLSHKFFLKEKVLKIKELIKKIDTTIHYLEGKQIMMSAREMSEGFFEEGGRGEIYAKHFLDNNLITQKELDAAKEKIRGWGIEIWQDIQKATEEIVKNIAYCMKNKIGTDSIYAQNFIEQHYSLMKRYLPLSKDAYISLANLYCENAVLRNILNGPKNPTNDSLMNEGLVDYLAAGMRIYAEQKLTCKPTESESIRTFRLS